MTFLDSIATIDHSTRHENPSGVGQQATAMPAGTITRDPTEGLCAGQVWPNPIVTELVPFERFYKAEDYHQGYFRNNPTQGYCQAMIGPKLAKLHKLFAGWVRA